MAFSAEPSLLGCVRYLVQIPAIIDYHSIETEEAMRTATVQ